MLDLEKSPLRRKKRKTRYTRYSLAQIPVNE